MEQLVLACAAFLATHFVSSTPLRGALAGAMGEKAYQAVYSLAAFATLGWMIWAYGKAPIEVLWPGLRLVPAFVMPFAFILMACGLLSRNPTLVGAGRLLKREDAASGILRITRHPLMWGFALWAGAHILARGELKATVFFGSFLVLALLGALSIDRRRAASAGEDWKRFASATSFVPLAAIASGRNRFVASEIGLRNPALGLALYALVFWFHPVLFGARAW